ncbi:MAG: hypothetical protein AB1505_17730 [Candidatus Latescibacterota bacterium]
MRPRGLTSLGVFVLLLVGVVILVRDAYVEHQAEQLGSAVVGAAVEVDGLSLRPLQPGLELERLQVANPLDTWRNLVETGKARFRMAPVPLLAGKLVIDEIAVTGLRFNTRRSTDGAIPGGGQAAAPAWVQRLHQELLAQVDSIPLVQVARTLRGGVNADSLIRVLDIRLSFTGAGIRFAFGDTAGEHPLLRQAVQRAFAAVERLEVQARIAGTLEVPRLRLDSNVGPLLVESLRALGAESALAARQQVQQRLQQKTAAVRRQAEARLEDLRRQVLPALAGYRQRIGESLAFADESTDLLRQRAGAGPRRRLEELF